MGFPAGFRAGCRDTAASLPHLTPQLPPPLLPSILRVPPPLFGGLHLMFFLAGNAAAAAVTQLPAPLQRDKCDCRRQLCVVPCSSPCSPPHFRVAHFHPMVWLHPTVCIATQECRACRMLTAVWGGKKSIRMHRVVPRAALPIRNHQQALVAGRTIFPGLTAVTHRAHNASCWQRNNGREERRGRNERLLLSGS